MRVPRTPGRLWRQLWPAQSLLCVLARFAFAVASDACVVVQREVCDRLRQQALDAGFLFHYSASVSGGGSFWMLNLIVVMS